MARVCERIYRIDSGAVIIRVWAKSDNLLDRSEITVQQATLRTAIREVEYGEDYTVSMAERLARIEFVNAVEVLWKDGWYQGGVLIYPDWP